MIGISKENEKILLDYLYLNMIIEVLEMKLTKLEDKHHELILNKIVEIRGDLRKVKEVMTNRTMSIHFDHKDRFFLVFKYYVKDEGDGEFRVWDSAARCKVKERLLKDYNVKV